MLSRRELQEKLCDHASGRDPDLGFLRTDVRSISVGFFFLRSYVTPEIAWFPSEGLALMTQRAQRSKKFDLDRNFQSRSKFLISLENLNLDVSISPQKIGPRWVARSKISFSIENFNLDRNLEFF